MTRSSATAKTVGAAAERVPAPMAELDRINLELSALTHIQPPELSHGAERSLADALVICGILGGKDVGKSTLINALARQEVSRDHAEVDVGTTRPMAYIHRDALPSYRRRFAAIDGMDGALDVTEHQADVLRNVVLVDLPDFDSDLPQHLETVQAVGPLLDRLIWVVTPRKIADREWVALLSDLVKDGHNVHCVLNKADELLDDAGGDDGLSDTFLDEQSAWVRDMIARTGCQHDEDHLFLVAAEVPAAELFVNHVARRWGDPEWSRYASDREAVRDLGKRLADELDRLRKCVLSPVTPGEAERLKQANRQIEMRRNVACLRTHYDLETCMKQLGRACNTEYHQAIFNDAFGPDYCTAVGRRLRAGQRSETELAETLLVDRVGRWPILPIIFWPMRWLVRRLGARFAGTRWTSTAASGDTLTVRGQTLADRLRLYGARVASDHGQVIRRFRLGGRLPEVETLTHRVTARAGSLVADLDDGLVALLRLGYRRPVFWKRWILWAILIWFPLVQPLAEGLLKLLGAGGTVDVFGGLLQIVAALGATRLLVGLVFATFVYVIILATMYARCVTQIRGARRGGDASSEDRDESLADHIDGLLISEVVGPLSLPFAETEQRLSKLQQRLSRLC